MPTSRRQFISRASTAVAGLALAPKIYAQSKGANDRITMGLIGCGGMGRANMEHFLDLKIPIAALCDVDEHQMDAAENTIKSKGQAVAPKRYKDFRKLLEQKDIDAVIIGTPDHWHALPFIAACEAGKDIYCEKPISHDFVEAKAMLSAARHFKPVVQIGTWQRSQNHFQKAIEYVQSGKMGKINLCRAWINWEMGSIGHQKPTTPPAWLDYDMWLGPASKHAYQPNRCHVNWRWFYDYGGGMMTDWGVHMIDIVLLAMREDPTHVSATGGIFTMDDDRDNPDTMQAIYQFPSFTMNWEHRFNNGRGLDGGRGHGTEFIGTKGTLIVDREGTQFFPNGDPKNIQAPSIPAVTDSTHWQNFLDCVKTREVPRSGIESTAKTTMLCHLGNISYECGKTVNWNSKKQEVINHSDVKHCISYQREYRKPWKLKMYS